MSTDPDKLYNALQTFLGIAADALQAAGRVVPERQFVADGSIVPDCKQLAVGVFALDLGLPGDVFTGKMDKRCGGYGRQAGIEIALTRCVPVQDERGNPPTVAQINASAQQIAGDGWVIFNGVLEAWRLGDVFDGCDTLAHVSDNAIALEGGIGGWSSRWRVQL